VTKTDTSTSTGASRRLSNTVRAWVLALIAVGLVCAAILHSTLHSETATLILRHAFVTLLFDGVVALAIMAVICSGGVCLVSFLRLGPMPARWRILLGASLGLGVVAILMLALGECGVLNRTVWIGILAVSAVGGVARCLTPVRRVAPARCVDPASSRGNHGLEARATRWRYLWLLTIPFAVSALLVAAQAPGYLWEEEGFGYDILEYHLQMPKEYLQAGRIAYAPHNVYANFPANVEMLYLLCMIVAGDPIYAAVWANCVHAMLAFLTVAAAWLAAREWSPRAGIVSGVVMGTTGWLVYLSGLAYVENGMLFFATMSLAAMLRAGRPRARSTEECDTREQLQTHRRVAGATAFQLRWIALSGALCGLACGCKYTAIAMFAAPVAVACLLLPDTSHARRARAAAVFLVAALATFSPWLIKNTVMTGNPVFPLADSVFKASPPGWDDQTRAGWNAGHAASDDERSISARLQMLWRRVVLDDDPRPGYGDRRVGFLILGLGLVGLLARKRERTDLILVLILGLQLLVWLSMTHLFARFAVVLLPPLAMLGGRAVLRPANRVISGLLILVLVAGVAWNFTHVRRMIGREVLTPGVAVGIYEGRQRIYEYFNVVNTQLPSDVRILMIGDAKAFYFRRSVDYCVVFNRNPFVDAIRAAKTDSEVIAWLVAQGYTHVLVNRLEIDRLRRSAYGFPAEVNPPLFERLEACGLKRTHVFTLPYTQLRYIELYEVPSG